MHICLAPPTLSYSLAGLYQSFLLGSGNSKAGRCEPWVKHLQAAPGAPSILTSPTVVIISDTFLPEDVLRLPWRLFQAWQSVMEPAVWTHVLGTDLYKTHFGEYAGLDLVIYVFRDCFQWPSLQQMIFQFFSFSAQWLCLFIYVSFSESGCQTR